MKILIVEDDQAVAQTLQFLFSRYNYAVDIADDGDAGLQMSEAYDYDLFLLDVVLPKLDGISLCQRLRAKGFQSPILLLTGQGEGRQKAIALNAGADDYVVKPFDAEELVARVQALLRRGHPTQQPILTWGPLSVDPSNRIAAYGTHLLAATPKEYAILELLLRNPQKALNARVILDNVWTSLESPGEEAVRVHIKELRQKLTAVGAPKDFIKTKHRVGYLLNPLYASTPTNQLTPPQIAELNAVNEQLRRTLEQLQLTQAELFQKNQELEQAYQTIAQERQQLQNSRDELEQRVAERTTELLSANQSLQKQQQALQESEQRYRLLSEVSPVGIFRNDLQGRCTYANAKTLEITGLTLEENLGEGWGKYLHPEDYDWMYAAWSNFVEQTKLGNPVTYEVEHRYLYPDGSLKWIFAQAVPEYNASEELTGFVGSVIDITDRKQMEIALRESEEKFRHFAENSHAAIWLADPVALHSVYVSPAYERIWGRTREDLLKRPESWLEVIHPDDHQPLQKKLEQERQGGKSNAEYRIVRPDGAIRWIRDSGFAIRDEAGKVYRYGGIAEDITERKQVELELRQREAFLRSIYDGADQAIFVIEVSENNEFYYMGHNRLAEQYSGLRNQDSQGKTPEEAYGPVIGSLFRQNYERCLRIGTSISYEEHLVFANHDIWTLTHLSPLRDEQGRIYRIVGTAIDISDRKQLNLALQASEAKLSRILDSAIAAISSLRVFKNRDWEYDYFSNGCEELFGYSRQELMADKTLWLSRVLPEDQDNILLRMFNDFFAERSGTVEFRFYRRDGSLHWISSTYASQKLDAQCWQVTFISYDITDRKQLEAQQRQATALIQKREEQFRLALELNYIGCWDLCIETGIETWNAYNYRLLGYEPGEVEPSFQRWRERLHPEDAPEVLQKFNQALAHQTDYEAEFRIILPDGTIRWLSGQGRGVYNEDGHPLRMIGVAFDITDRKQAEAALQESERRYQQILDSIADIVVVKQPDSRLVWGNKAFRDYYGMTQEELKGVVDAPFNNPDYTHHYLHDDALVFTHGQTLLIPEEPVTRYDGVVRTFSTIKAPIFDETGQVVLLVAVGRDITEQQAALRDRKLANQKIQEQAELLDITSDAIFVRDCHHRILYWNKGAERLYEWQAAEAIGRSADELLKNDPVQVKQIMQHLLQQGTWRGEVRKFTKTGREVVVDARWNLVRNEAGKPKFILSVNTDITERKLLETQFYRAQRLESLGTLASGIAHDLNNVLTPILTIAQVLRLKSLNLDLQSKEMLKVLEDSAKRGADMLKQILTFTRGTSGESGSVDVIELLQEIINVVQQTFPKSIKISQHLPENTSWLVSADSTYLHQVFMNLCVNARDAMPDGGLLSFSAEQHFVDLSFAQTNLDAQVGNYIVLTIGDTGIGISPDDLDRIFDPFFTTKAAGQGTGLGLATVLGIVKNYGGFLQVSSEVGIGTQMRVFLPMLEAVLSGSPLLQETLEGQGRRILLVDDDVAIQSSTQSLLEQYHFSVLTSSEGQSAIELYLEHQNKIQLVILDVMMPQMNGITLVQQLRLINPTVKIIAMSGLPANRELVLAAGANAFLLKPYTVEQLLEILQSLI